MISAFIFTCCTIWNFSSLRTHLPKYFSVIRPLPIYFDAKKIMVNVTTVTLALISYFDAKKIMVNVTIVTLALISYFFNNEI